jgi:hypothetical protein
MRTIPEGRWGVARRDVVTCRQTWGVGLAKFFLAVLLFTPSGFPALHAQAQGMDSPSAGRAGTPRQSADSHAASIIREKDKSCLACPGIRPRWVRPFSLSPRHRPARFRAFSTLQDSAPGNSSAIFKISTPKNRFATTRPTCGASPKWALRRGSTTSLISSGHRAKFVCAKVEQPAGLGRLLPPDERKAAAHCRGCQRHETLPHEPEGPRLGRRQLRIHLETNLVKPIAVICNCSKGQVVLRANAVSVDYAPVLFHSQNVELWLPQSAVAYSDYGDHRVMIEHTFSNFRLFSVQTQTVIGKPKEF